MAIEQIVALLRNNTDPRKLDDIKRLWPELGKKLESLLGIQETPKPVPASSLRNDVDKTVLDFSAGLPDPGIIKSNGHVGVIHYVSDKRPGSNWMIAKPVTKSYADKLRSLGLSNVSNFQLGKGTTSDWRFGFENGVKCAKRAVELHLAAGGPENAVIYASIDDDPTYTEFVNLIRPYLLGWESVIGHYRLGVYGNYDTIQWCIEDKLGEYFWQHYWNGTGDRKIHPRANVTQERIDKDKVDGVGVDINVVHKIDYGQWR